MPQVRTAFTAKTGRRSKARIRTKGLGMTKFKTLSRLRTYTIVTKDDSEYGTIKKTLRDMEGVSIKAEAPVRHAISVSARESRRLSQFLEKKGVKVRDEVTYAPED